MPDYPFYTRLARILNSGQSRSVILSGDVYDLFHNGQAYVPLVPFLAERSKTAGLLRIVYELNGPIRVLDEPDRLKNAWIQWRTGRDADTLLLEGLRAKGPSRADQVGAEFDQLLVDAIGNASLALEVLRQLTICTRTTGFDRSLLIILEAADMLLPAGTGDVASLNDRQLHRIAVAQDWLSDPAFISGRDSVCLIAESRSLVHPRVARLPQVLGVEVPPPDYERRLHFIQSYGEANQPRPKLWSTPEELARLTAGLSIHALRQVLAGAAYGDQPVEPADVVGKVEEFIQAQLGEDVVEFKRPTHTLDDVVGFARLKQFIRSELIPRLQAEGDKALPGAAVAGPIGGGKTFIFEAMAAELDAPVLVLKGIRSQWFGQTDVIFERLRRSLQALEKVLIFVDEADTQFGGVGPDTHETERRLTGKIQAMMSDPALRGRVAWLLMTARIHRLSPDLRRPGRVGDLIIPVLDPEDEDRRAFLAWLVKGLLPPLDEAQLAKLDALTRAYSAAEFASLRSHLKAAGPKTLDDVLAIARDHIPPAIGLTRRYQTLQALINCTRRSLLPDPSVTDADRDAWYSELRRLETLGIS
jgi:AAA+ superfamily predicted ATPase